MEISKTAIPDCLIFQPQVFSDSRGSFMETFRLDIFQQHAGNYTFVQENESVSHAGVLRGLHFQGPPFAQGKLVSVVQGSVLDVAVDIRKNSPFYGKAVTVELSAENKRRFWIPPGFAHGFLALENHTVFQYKCTAFYDKASEGSLLFSDPQLEISWPRMELIVNQKDLDAPALHQLVSPF